MKAVSPSSQFLDDSTLSLTRSVVGRTLPIEEHHDWDSESGRSAQRSLERRREQRTWHDAETG